MDHQRALYLLKQYADDRITGEERAELSKMISEDSNGKLFPGAIREGMENAGADPDFDPVKWQHILAKVVAVDKPAGKVIRMNVWRRVAAAAIIVIFAAGGYIYFNKETVKQNDSGRVAEGNKSQDIAPGKQGAVLTLGNGRTIVLDTARNGKLLGNFTKNDESIIVESTEIEYATLTTPKARTQAITLSDGSRVWLNAASSIHFPTMFKGNERKVEITGEAYFEVAHDESKPFSVSVNGMNVQVLGTHFNINAYGDEDAIKTTLLEGSVRVTTANRQQSTVIKPGQQAILSGKGQLATGNADLEEAVAWKNGMFSFHSADIQTIMRQVARWYDVDVVFEGQVPKKRFNGETSRNLNASQMLKVLEESGIKFRIEGKKIIVVE